MTDYVKLIDKLNIEYAPVNKDGIMNYNLDVERMIADGYKELVSAEIPEDEIRMLHLEYKETKSSIKEVIVYDETEEEASARALRIAKENKHNENNEKAEIARENQFFTIEVDNKECTFQTSRKTQQDLLTAKEMITLTEQPYQWFSDNNEEVYLTLEDLKTISVTFMQKANVYPQWSIYETLVDQAQTAKEVEAIEIDYEIEVSELEKLLK